MRQRGRPGVALGSGLAFVVVVAVAVPSAELVRERFFAVAPEPVVVAPTPVVATIDPSAPGVRAALAALDQVQQRVEQGAAAAVQLEQRAREAERGERLRQLGRVVARARDVRRAQGQSGPQLRGPFPVRELGDLSGFGLGAQTRWLVGRDGRALAPDDVTAAVLTPELVASLATRGRDEEPLVLPATIEGQQKTIVRRCLPAEGYCVVDVEGPVLPAASVDLGPLRGSITELRSPTLIPGPLPSSSSSSSSSVPATSPWWALLAVGIGMGLAVVVVVRLRQVGGAVVGQALRLRSGLAGRPVAAGAALSAEIAELDRAVDAAFAALGLHADGVMVDDERRARLTAVADALDAARTRGGLERVVPAAADDAVTARMVQSANGLLDALDERARRSRVLLDDVNAVGDVLPSLAQRLLRLARVPGLPQALADELSSLGNAVAARVGADSALDTLKSEAAHFSAPSTGPAERFATVAALRDLPTADIARAVQSGSATPSQQPPESLPEPPRQTE